MTESSGSTLANTIVAVIIFVIVSFTFLFPLNRLITLDRRSVSVLGATLCYAARLFTNNGMDILNAIDFDVLVLLASIMVSTPVNFPVRFDQTSSAPLSYILIDCRQ